MDPRLELDLLLSRRQFFAGSGLRLGAVAIAAMAAQAGSGATALADAPVTDRRVDDGAARGGRRLAASVIERMLAAP